MAKNPGNRTPHRYHPPAGSHTQHRRHPRHDARRCRRLIAKLKKTIWNDQRGIYSEQACARYCRTWQSTVRGWRNGYYPHPDLADRLAEWVADPLECLRSDCARQVDEIGRRRAIPDLADYMRSSPKLVRQFLRREPMASEWHREHWRRLVRWTYPDYPGYTHHPEENS